MMRRAHGRKALFIIAHPYLQKSRANRAVAEAVADLPGLTFHPIYDRYPYFHIDVESEKQLLLEHDLVVVQHPFYWYSMPALLKLWVDEVLESGFAYGPGGDKLKDKEFLLSITIGGPQESYTPQSYNGYPVETLLTPWMQTTNICQMHWNPPLLLYRAIEGGDEDLETYVQTVRHKIETFLKEGLVHK
jgi:putative NADPH-quinone reductase